MKYSTELSKILDEKRNHFKNNQYDNGYLKEDKHILTQFTEHTEEDNNLKDLLKIQYSNES